MQILRDKFAEKPKKAERVKKAGSLHANFRWEWTGKMCQHRATKRGDDQRTGVVEPLVLNHAGRTKSEKRVLQSMIEADIGALPGSTAAGRRGSTIPAQRAGGEERKAAEGKAKTGARQQYLAQNPRTLAARVRKGRTDPSSNLSVTEDSFMRGDVARCHGRRRAYSQGKEQKALGSATILLQWLYLSTGWTRRTKS